VFKGDPWFGRCGSSARSGSAAPEEEGRNERKLSRLLHKGIRAHCPASVSCRTSGCERGRGPTQVATRLRSAGGPSAANTVSVDAKDAGIELTARADSRSALGSRDCGAVGLLSTQIVRKQAKAIISNDASYCMSRRRQRFPTVRTSRSLGKRRSLGEDVKY